MWVTSCCALAPVNVIREEISLQYFFNSDFFLCVYVICMYYVTFVLSYIVRLTLVHYIIFYLCIYIYVCIFMYVVYVNLSGLMITKFYHSQVHKKSQLQVRLLCIKKHTFSEETFRQSDRSNQYLLSCRTTTTQVQMWPVSTVSPQTSRLPADFWCCQCHRSQNLFGG